LDAGGVAALYLRSATRGFRPLPDVAMPALPVSFSIGFAESYPDAPQKWSVSHYDSHVSFAVLLGVLSEKCKICAICA
jgi:hypothetical protein